MAGRLCGLLALRHPTVRGIDPTGWCQVGPASTAGATLRLTAHSHQETRTEPVEPIPPLGSAPPRDRSPYEG
jgi:hypothetical protein